MEKEKVVERIKQVGLIPILRTPTAEDAISVAEVLHASGLVVIELPLTVPGAVAAIARLTGRFGEQVLVGAGTVLDEAGARACIEAGATFIISPSFEPEVVRHCKSAGVAVMPGALTPTEIVAAWRAGADMVKVFPAS